MDVNFIVTAEFHCSILGRWINEINDKFGFYIILILSLLIFVTLLIVNKTDKIKYAHKEE